MKNYYEILEVSRKASPEVIEKAHKALIKKYHPDLQPQDKKQEAEDKVKLINEAYEILSDINKKNSYDRQLNYEEQVKKQKEYNSNINNNYREEKHYNDIKNTQNSNLKNQVIKTPKNYQEEQYDDINVKEAYKKVVDEAYSNAYSKAYNDAYINSLKSMGYDVRYQKTFMQYLKEWVYKILFILVLVIICIIAWHIPPIKKYFIELYNTNEIFRFIGDIISNIINSIFK